MYKKLQDSEWGIKEIGSDSNTESSKQDCLHIFEGAKSDIMYTVQYRKNNDIGKIYLGMPKMEREWVKSRI